MKKTNLYSIAFSFAMLCSCGGSIPKTQMSKSNILFADDDKVDDNAIRLINAISSFDVESIRTCVDENEQILNTYFTYLYDSDHWEVDKILDTLSSRQRMVKLRDSYNIVEVLLLKLSEKLEELKKLKESEEKIRELDSKAIQIIQLICSRDENIAKELFSKMPHTKGSLAHVLLLYMEDLVIHCPNVSRELLKCVKRYSGGMFRSPDSDLFEINEINDVYTIVNPFVDKKEFDLRIK